MSTKRHVLKFASVVFILLVYAVGICYGARYATVYLKNGDRLTGSDLVVERGVVQLRFRDSKVQIPLDDVGNIVPFDDLTLVPSATAEKHYQNAQTLLELGLRDKAKAQLLAAIDEFPKYAEAYYQLGRLLQEEENTDEALKYFGYAAAISPQAYNMAEQFKQVGDGYLASEDYAKAIEAYSLLFRHYPDHEAAPTAAYTAGFLLAEQSEDKSEEALEVLQHASTQYPENPQYEKALYWIGALQAKTGKADQAVDTLTQFILTYPESEWLAQAYLARGNAYLQLRFNKEATSDFSFAYENTSDLKLKSEAERKRNESAWTVYTVSDGLPSNQIQAIAVDENVLWIGTPKGLAKVDVSMEPWNVMTNVTSYINNLFDEREPINVRALAVDDRELWIGTLNHGAIQYNKLADLPESHDHRSGLPHKTVNDIEMDEAEVWVGTFSGIARYQRASRQWTTYTVKNDGLPADEITAVAVTPKTVWIGTPANGMAIYDRQTDYWRAFGTYDNLELQPGSAIVDFAVNSEQVFFTWYYRRESDGYGVLRPNAFGQYESQVHQVIVGNPPIVPVENIYITVGKASQPQSEGGASERGSEAPEPKMTPLWIATNAGLYIYMNGWVLVEFPTDRLGVPTANCIALGDGAVWVGTSSGLAKIDADALGRGR